MDALFCEFRSQVDYSKVFILFRVSDLSEDCLSKDNASVKIPNTNLF